MGTGHRPCPPPEESGERVIPPGRLADQAHRAPRVDGPLHRQIAASACALVDLLTAQAEDLIRLSPEERADVLGRGLACGIVAALRGGDPRHAVARLRAVARWVATAADQIEASTPIYVATPEDVPRALAAVAERRAA